MNKQITLRKSSAALFVIAVDDFSRLIIKFVFDNTVNDAKSITEHIISLFCALFLYRT